MESKISKTTCPNILQKVCWFCVILELESSSILWRSSGQVPDLYKDKNSYSLSDHKKLWNKKYESFKYISCRENLFLAGGISKSANLPFWSVCMAQNCWNPLDLSLDDFLVLFPTRNKLFKNWCVLRAIFLNFQVYLAEKIVFLQEELQTVKTFHFEVFVWHRTVEIQ